MKSILILTMLASSCSLTRLDSRIFSIDDPVDAKYLVKNGFNKADGVDIPTYYTENNDTTVVYTFDFDNKTLLTKSWVVHFDKISIKVIEDLFAKYNVTSTVVSFRESREYKTYILYSPSYNQYYDWRYDSKENTIRINYKYPININ